MTETNPDPAPRPREVFERMRRALARDDRGVLADLMAEDGVIEWPFTRPGAPSRIEGRQAIREFVTASPIGRLVRFEDLRADAVHETLDPEVIIVESTTIGELRETGRRFELHAIAVLTIRDGEIHSYRDYVNPLAAVEAVGPLRELPATPGGGQQTAS